MITSASSKFWYGEPNYDFDAHLQLFEYNFLNVLKSSQQDDDVLKPKEEYVANFSLYEIVQEFLKYKKKTATTNKKKDPYYCVNSISRPVGAYSVQIANPNM